MSVPAQCAKAIRTDLKLAFPKTKFSVTSESYAGGDSVNVYYLDGPADEQVNKLIKKYQRGHFNGMEDIYEYSNENKELPQVQYVFANRTMSDKFYLKAAQLVQKLYSDFENATPHETIEDLGIDLSKFGDYMTWRNVAYRILNKIDLTNAIGIRHIENSIGSMYDGFVAIKVGEK